MPTVVLKGEPDGYGETGFHPSGLIWPGEGCWEVTARVGKESLTFVTLVARVPIEPLWPMWLPEGLVNDDTRLSPSPWSIQQVFRSADGSNEVILETTQGSRENDTLYPGAIPEQVVVNGQPGACVRGSADEQGQWQVEADGAVLEWEDGALSYSIRQTGAGLGCEDLLKIAAGPE
jgi:hypothetical protein